MTAEKAAVAVKISTRELDDEITPNPAAKIAVKIAMRPRIKPIERTSARMVMATTGRRQATTVVIMEAIRWIHDPE